MLCGAGLVVVVAGMQAAASILVPFLLALFVSVICAQPLGWLQKKGFPTPLGILIVAGVLALLVLLVVVLVGNSFDDFSNRLPDYQKDLGRQTEALQTWLQQRKFIKWDEELIEPFDPKAAMGFVVSILNGFIRTCGNAFVILVLVIFMLYEASHLPDKLRAGLSESPGALESVHQILANIRRYMAIKTLLSLLTGVLVTVWLMILGVAYPVLWGLLAFLLNYIPNIGSILAAVPAVLMALIDLGVGPALWTGIGYLAVNMAIGNFLEPRVMGRGLGLSTLVVFLSLVFWGWVLGPVGMLLSAPLTMAVRIALESRHDTHWLAVLMGPEAPRPGP